MKYISKCHNQVLTMKPNRTQIVDGVPYAVQGEHARFSANEFETEDKKMIDWLNKHRLNGTAFIQAQAELEMTAK